MKRIATEILSLTICLIILLTGCNQNRSAITTGSLFEEMIDMTKLTSFPEPAFRTVQYSSYDHRSTLPGGPDWFANADGFGGEPIPNFEKVLKAPDENGVGEYLIADVKGPGAVVRLWTASISGTLRVTLDGSDQPLFDGSADDFFRRPYAAFSEMEHIDRERFEKTVYQRDASYAPIPFVKRLRVVWTGNVKEIHFYQFQVRLYQKGASVVSFSPQDIARYAELIDRVTLALSNPDEHLDMHSDEAPRSFTSAVAPSEKKEMIHLDGPMAVEKLTLRLRAEDMDKALRQTLLLVECDDYPDAQVQAPVGDFFGAAPGVNPYTSLPFTVRPDGTMICRFIMPFEKSFRLTLDNQGDQEVSVEGTVLPMPFSWTERSMHFRARWRAGHNIIASNEDIQDLPFLIANGKGVYVGTTSYLLNPNPIPTPWGNWWGEGDEKVFVDDDAVPSIFGTGSEDYYNYSWSSPDIFDYPYCGQPRNDGPGNRGFVTNYRWHILDAIPFENRIRFTMELFSHERTPGLSYARIAYHYARPGLTDDHQPIMPEDVRHLLLPFPWQPEARFGARNAQFYAAENLLAERRNTRLEQGRLWAGGRVLIWTPEKIGDSKSFSIPVNVAGKKRITITAAMTPRSGRMTVLLDGAPLSLTNESETVDLYRPYRTLLRNFTLVTAELSRGLHTLTCVYSGTEATIPRPEIGIDFIWVQNIDR
ncbi:MAG: glycoside hydrolase family 172 protein [bacterium]